MLKYLPAMLCDLLSLGHQDTSKVSAHLSTDGVLSAVIDTSAETYHIEPSHHYIHKPHPFQMVAYASSHVKQRLNFTKDDIAVASPPFVSHNTLEKSNTPSHFKMRTAHHRLRRQTSASIDRRSCTMVAIADHTAFQGVFRSSVDGAIVQLVGSIH